jgi:hypothetical protein
MAALTADMAIDIASAVAINLTHSQIDTSAVPLGILASTEP